MSDTIDKTIEGNKRASTSPTSPPPSSPSKYEGENLAEMRSIISHLTEDLSSATAHGKKLEVRLRYMAVAWLLHGCCMAVTGLLHDGYMTVAWLEERLYQSEEICRRVTRPASSSAP